MRGDARPVHWLLVVQYVALLVLAGWWLFQDDTTRRLLLTAIFLDEQAFASPPDDLWAQPGWLLAHRWARLQGVPGFALLALVIGVVQGVFHRRRDPRAGVRLRLWTLGVLSVPLVLGSVVAYLVLPWPLSLTWTAYAMAVLVGCGGFALTAGRPAIP